MGGVWAQRSVGVKACLQGWWFSHSQPLLTEADVGKVALSCHFACDALCAELYDWDEVERG